MEKITSVAGENQSDWLTLAADIGIYSDENRGQLMSILPTLAESTDLASAITSLEPKLLPAAERDSVLSELEGYVNHESPEVRRSAIMSATMWGGNQQAGIIESGLQDTSSDVRHAATISALTSNVHSNDIKSNLIRIMSDENEDISTREQAFTALSRYTLSGSDYDLYYAFSIKNLPQS